jgi:hypothetical protein
MKKIIDFPTKSVRDNALIEKAINEMLSQTSADDKAKSEISQRLLELWKKYQCEFSPIPISIPEHIDEKDRLSITKSIEKSIAGFKKSLHDHMKFILIERMEAEVKLFLLESNL